MNDVSHIGMIWQWVSEAYKPDPPYTVSEWADKNRMLSSKASAEPGQWRTDRTPYLREIMDSLSAYSTVETVAVMKGAQIGMSEAGLNFVGYVIHHAPGPILYVMPTVDTAKRVSKTRVNPMIEASPALRDRIPSQKSRDSSNTMFEKEFPNGVFVLTGANSGSGLRNVPMRYLILDEVDAYPASTDGEGDPVTLAIKRASTFVRRKIFMLSTPLVKGTSRIGAAFREGDQRYYNVACDKCGTLQPITWKAIKWPKGEPHKAGFVCQSVDSDGEICGHFHGEHRKAALLSEANGACWIATAEPIRPGIRSYHLSGLYSPWATWAEAAQEFIACHGKDGKPDPARLQVFVNTVLGEEWEETGDRVEAGGLIDLREDWAGIPVGVAVITAGVDVQPDRLEIELVGWGADEESWSIDYHIIPGDPSGADVWQQLDSYLGQRFEHPGFETGIPVSAACIDTGGSNTNAVYAYAKPRAHKRIWPIKGSSVFTAPIWPKRPGRNNKGKINLYSVGVSAAKETIYKRLGRVGPAHSGAGACHFPLDRDVNYFEQLTAETLKTKFIKGFPVRFWDKPENARNEALDCRVYAYAALHGLFSMGVRLNQQAATVAKRIEHRVREGQIQAPAMPAEPPASAPVETTESGPAAVPAGGKSKVAVQPRRGRRVIRRGA